MDILEAATYPARDIDVRSLGENTLELAAALYATAGTADDLDRMVGQLRRLEGVEQAYWAGATED